MRRIFFSRVVLLFSCLVLVQFASGQNSFFVYKKSGAPKLNTNLEVQRGSYLGDKDELTLQQNDYVLLLDNLGQLFELKQAKKYTFSDIFNYRRKLKNDSFTKKYFAYIWRQFTNKRKSKQEPGVVYREDRNVKSVSPVDSALVYQPNIWFKWQNKANTGMVYYFLKDQETDHITKIGTVSDSLLLHLDNVLLKPGKKYNWAVSSTSFPDLNKLKFNNLHILTKENYQILQNEIKALTASLKSIGFTKNEIQEAVCLSYKFCNF